MAAAWGADAKASDPTDFSGTATCCGDPSSTGSFTPSFWKSFPTDGRVFSGRGSFPASSNGLARD
jgi:hypothetical protein